MGRGSSGLGELSVFPCRHGGYRRVIEDLHSEFLSPEGQLVPRTRAQLKRKLRDTNPAPEGKEDKRPTFHSSSHQGKEGLGEVPKAWGAPANLARRRPQPSVGPGEQTPGSPRDLLAPISLSQLANSGGGRRGFTLAHQTPRGASRYPSKENQEPPGPVLPPCTWPPHRQVCSPAISGGRLDKSRPESPQGWKELLSDHSLGLPEEGGSGPKTPRCALAEGTHGGQGDKEQRPGQPLPAGGQPRRPKPPAAELLASLRRYLQARRNGGPQQPPAPRRAARLLPQRDPVAETGTAAGLLTTDGTSSPQQPIWETQNTAGRWLEKESRTARPPQPDLSQERAGLHNTEKHCSATEMEQSPEGLPELTQDMEKEIRSALGSGPQEEILSSTSTLTVTRGDLQTLSDSQWLNDEIINFYLRLLVDRSQKRGLPRLHAFSTFFYPKLTTAGYQGVRRWTKGLDLFQQDLILVPIHQRAHWSLLSIDLRKKTIKHLDSMAGKDPHIHTRMLQYLQEESKSKRNTELDPTEWTLDTDQSWDIPQQSNTSDCGVFLCKYADYISQDKPFTFTQNHMPHFRKRMVWEILQQQVL
ncbi:sentrin-specific protease 2-like [Gracilinanus agilis]|uniref:sentrin-specific protease 2-like n=1 Tax=Gracilinanus agilis TaxID=191870 RepID=UPI001CFF051D|nr:sentrin-specific protease 2-like [Gracilinanus agilis]